MLIDVAFAICIVYGFYMGYKNEPMNKIFRLFPFLAGLLTGIYLGPIIYDKVAGMWGSDGVLLFLITFIFCCFIGWSFSKYLADMFTTAAKKANIKKPEKMLNGITLSFLFAILFSGLIAFFNKAEIISSKTKDTSISLTVLESLPIKVKESFSRLQPGFKKFYQKSNEVIDHKKSED